MPAACRLGDLCTGHGCWPTRPNSSASSDVFVNDVGSHRVGDLWQPHSCRTTHDGIAISGSPDVFVNDKPKVRVGDLIDCGSLVLSGSPDVETN
jgi:uncharacterized Zn-binding protein involved in type VI secretion